MMLLDFGPNCDGGGLVSRAFLVTPLVKNQLLPIQETWVQSLGQEDPLEKKMATHSNILAWKSHGQRSLLATKTAIISLMTFENQ